MTDERGKRFIGSTHGAMSKFLPEDKRGEHDVVATKHAVAMKAAIEAERHRVTADFLVRALHDLKGEGTDPEFVQTMDRLVELWHQVRPRVSAG
jgi:hypothetical protein